MIKQRGRPRQFNRDKALEAAMHVFWSKGLTATSLDDLSAAMNMNRPSLYNAFGNKESIYQQALNRFTDWMGQQLGEVLFAEPDLKTALKLFYNKALDVYLGSTVPLGCFVSCTCPAEAATHPDIQKSFYQVISEVDAVLEKRLLISQAAGHWPLNKDPQITAKLLQATLQSLALRARAGESRNSLENIYLMAIDMFCQYRG